MRDMTYSVLPKRWRYHAKVFLETLETRKYFDLWQYVEPHKLTAFDVGPICEQLWVEQLEGVW